MKFNVTYSEADRPNGNQIESLSQKAVQALQLLKTKRGKGNDFLGWVDLPAEISQSDLEEINSCAEEIRNKSDIFVVAGIGGSYLGARAVIESLKHNFDYLLDNGKSPIIIYAGNTLSEDYAADLMDILDKKDYSLCVISKSGTTTETAVTFRILRNHLEKKYGHEQAVSRIIAVTDKEKGVLKAIADKEGYKTFVIPDNVGGRFSVLTPVGLLPIAVAGFDIKALVDGAANIRNALLNTENTKENIAVKYAVTRNYLYNIGKEIELLVNYQPDLIYFSEWFKQLYGESEGKENKGLFPASVSNTTDLHSMGQYIQQGKRLMFETILHVENANHCIQIPYQEDDDDKLNYLSGFSMMQINHKAEEGTSMAHADGGVTQLQLSIDRINEENIGKLIYFFELACGISGYMLDVNPFDQPGVEFYKKNMFALLGKK
ncbi:MAG: glucose-6-phosphate isomerase [Bacteroidales bacterium]|nr:glucose-6-phosphate isomerase [Bacteroidales bacterium]